MSIVKVVQYNETTILKIIDLSYHASFVTYDVICRRHFVIFHWFHYWIAVGALIIDFQEKLTIIEVLQHDQRYISKKTFFHTMPTFWYMASFTDVTVLFSVNFTEIWLNDVSNWRRISDTGHGMKKIFSKCSSYYIH